MNQKPSMSEQGKLSSWRILAGDGWALPSLIDQVNLVEPIPPMLKSTGLFLNDPMTTPCHVTDKDDRTLKYKNKASEYIENKKKSF